MKNLLRYAALLFSAVSLLGLTVACGGDEPEPVPEPPEVKNPELTAEVVSTTAFSAEVAVSVKQVSEFAYAAYTEEQSWTDETVALFFAQADQKVTCDKDGVFNVNVNHLEAMKDYWVYFVAKVSGENEFLEVVAVNFTTTDFTEDFTIFNVSPNEFSVHVKVPESVYRDREKREGHVIKWGITSLLNYMDRKAWGTTDAEMLGLNDGVYHNYFSSDSTLVFNVDNSLVRNWDGSVYVDPEAGPDDDAILTYYAPFAPGEPIVLLLGEYGYGMSDMGWDDPGYYIPSFDYDGYFEKCYGGGGGWDDDPGFGVNPLGANPMSFDPMGEAEFWTGYYKNELVVLGRPGVLDADVKIDLSGLSPKGGYIRFTPDEGVFRYCVCVLDDNAYELVLNMFAVTGDPESFLQYFSTSYYAFTYGLATSLEGPVDLNLNEVTEVNRDATYHLLVTAVNDESGTFQKFYSETFELPAPTLPEPTAVVTPLESPADGTEASPYYVWFNVKAPGKDVEEGYLLCNGLYDFAPAFNFQSLLEIGRSNARYQYGKLTEEELAKLNSDEGLDVAYPTKPGETLVLAAYVLNSEGTENVSQADVYKLSEAEANNVAARNTAMELPAAEKVESAYFSSLKGDWTATAKVTWKSYYNDDGKYDYATGEKQHTKEIKTKVTIGDLSCPASLPEEYYSLYNSKEEADAYYKELKEGVDKFNARTRGQNRLLCNGFNFDIAGEPGVSTTYCDYASPFDLFVNENYSSYDVNQLFRDFGPKWYIQVGQDGSLSVPFDYLTMDPMSSWGNHELYLAGRGETDVLYAVSSDKKESTGYFPIEVKDENTLVLKSISVDGKTYSPVVTYESNGNFYLTSQIISDIVLTKGWSGTATHSVEKGCIAQPYSSAVSGQKVNKAVYKGCTPLMPSKSYNKVSCKIVTKEDFLSSRANSKSKVTRR